MYNRSKTTLFKKKNSFAYFLKTNFPTKNYELSDKNLLLLLIQKMYKLLLIIFLFDSLYKKKKIVCYKLTFTTYKKFIK